MKARAQWISGYWYWTHDDNWFGPFLELASAMDAAWQYVGAARL